MPHCGRPLLRDARQTRAWPVLATCVFVIAVLGLQVRGQAQPGGLDSAVDDAVVASFHGSQGVLPWLALPGSTIPLIGVSVAIAAGCLIARRPSGAALAVTAVPVTAFLDDTVLKHLIGRTHLGQLSFPSGHVAAAMTLATVLGVLLHDPARRVMARMIRAALVVTACALTALVAAGVIGLRWHYFTDQGHIAVSYITPTFNVRMTWCVVNGCPAAEPTLTIAGSHTATGPAPAFLGGAHGTLYIAWRDDGNSQIDYVKSVNGKKFSVRTRIPKALTGQTPALAASGSTLYAVWRGQGSNDHLWYSSATKA